MGERGAVFFFAKNEVKKGKRNPKSRTQSVAAVRPFPWPWPFPGIESESEEERKDRKENRKGKWK